MQSYKDIEKITKLHTSIQNQLLRIFARVDIADKLIIIKQQKKIFFYLKNTYGIAENEILTYSAFVLSINQYLNTNKNHIKVSIFKATKFRKSFKREKILGKWAIIKNLRNNKKLSFRQISTYLQKYYRFNVSYSLIYKIWSELEEKNINEGEKNG